MLIVTDRHKPEDLELWRDYEDMDNASTVSHAKQSIALIKSWRTDGVAYTSWGKDSVVLMHLSIMAGQKIPFVYVKFNDRHNPDCEFLERFNIDYHEECCDYAEVRKGDKHWKAVAKKYSGHRMTGIRNDESGRRLMIYKMYRFESNFSFRPLSLWKNQEIFAYIHQNELPLCPVYGYLGGGRWPRDKIRTHSLAGSTADGFGRTEWE